MYPADLGHKGQNARSGGGVRPGFEGGQIPLYRKLPKRGFKNRFAKEYTTVNISALERFEDGAVVDLDLLANAGLAQVLGNGNVDKKFTVRAAAFTAAAKEKIEAAGGKCEVV